jgi:hypothetical protein
VPRFDGTLHGVINNITAADHPDPIATARGNRERSLDLHNLRNAIRAVGASPGALRDLR